VSVRNYKDGLSIKFPKINQERKVPHHSSLDFQFPLDTSRSSPHNKNLSIVQNYPESPRSPSLTRNFPMIRSSAEKIQTEFPIIQSNQLQKTYDDGIEIKTPKKILEPVLQKKKEKLISIQQPIVIINSIKAINKHHISTKFVSQGENTDENILDGW
jgi:hypothetical protein